jgi:hypothetical protein
MASGYSNIWYRLTPDVHGSYVNSTNWTTNAPMQYVRFDFASQVLQDGRVFVAGGEESGPGAANAEVYDPLTDIWTEAPVPQTYLDPTTRGWLGQYGAFADSISEILPNGNVMVAPNDPSPAAFSTLIYNPGSNTWTNGPSVLTAYGSQHEASWVKLPDDSILTVDPPSIYLVQFQGTNYFSGGNPDMLTNQTYLYSTNIIGGTNNVLVYPPNTSERYIPSLNQWVSDTPLPVFLYSFGSEIGPALLLSDGRAFFIGASGHTAYYTPSGNTNSGAWTRGPDIPGGFICADLPAAMMVNGKILCGVADPTGQNVGFYEFDPTNGPNGSFEPTSNPFNVTNGATTGNFDAMYLLDLPDGTVLLTGFEPQVPYIYQPDTPPLATGKPTINEVLVGLRNYHSQLTGTLLNGISEGATFGDDAQMNSNYPLVRMTNLVTGLVYYARTYNWSSTGVMTGTNLESTDFTLPAALPYGNYSLVVVANGISSDPYPLLYLPGIQVGAVENGHPSITISWVDPVSEFRLQQTSDPQNGPWVDIKDATSPFTYNIINNEPMQFFRLAGVIAYPPSTITSKATQITSSGARFNGTVNPNGANATWWFEYGYDTNYTFGTTSSGVVSASNTHAVSVSNLVSGLYALTLYHCQLVASNLAGISLGGDQQFTTLGLPPVVVTLPASSITSDSAVLNGTVNGEGTAIAGYFEYWYFQTVEGGGEWITNQTSQFYGPANYNAQSFSATITNLDFITYYYQIIGYNGVSEGFGAVTNFTRGD